VLQADDYSGGRIERVDLETGAVSVLYTHAGGVPLRGPNDIVFDGQGGFWFTDLGKVREHDMDRGRVFYARADGSAIHAVIHPLFAPNGIGLSPDDATLYVAETPTARLWAFDITAPGEIRRDPWPSPHGGRLVRGSENYQTFDSLAVERDGNVCVATLMNCGISIIAADGSSARHVPFPDLYTTNICFGGEDLCTAYITLSASGRLVKVDWPRPGLALHHLNR
jgi:gluconolactonase